MKSIRNLLFVFLFAMLTVMSALNVSAACKHSYPAKGWVTVKAATCTADGKEERVCILCGKKQSRAVNKKGHNWGSWKTTVKATCTKTGSKYRDCSRCGAKESKSIAKASHNWVTHQENLPA